MKKNKLMQIFLLVMLLLNTVLPSLATTVSAAGITKNEQAKAGTGTISAVFFEDLNNNEQQDPSEPGVGGIELTLFDATANKNWALLQLIVVEDIRLVIYLRESIT